MNKKLIAGIAVAGALIVAAAAGLGGSKATGIDTEDKAFNTLAQLQSQDVFYFDSEAVALSNASDVDTGLRAEALEAYNQVNDERVAAGLDSLKWDQNLETVCSVRAKECATKFSHTRPNGKAWNSVNSKIQGGENLAFGFDTASDCVDAWMNSPTHRDNILYGEFDKVAIGIYQTDDGTCYWAQEYGY